MARRQARNAGPRSDGSIPGALLGLTLGIDHPQEPDAGRFAGSNVGSGGGGVEPPGAGETGAKLDMPRPRSTWQPRGGAPLINPPNPARLVGSIVLATNWTQTPAFDGPVIVVPYLMVAEGTILGHPNMPPNAGPGGGWQDFLAIRSRGNGVLYLPAGGTWYLKYNSAGPPITVAFWDARNPAVLAWYMAAIGGASLRTLPTTALVGAASGDLFGANPYRTCAMVSVITESIILTWGQNAVSGATPNGLLLTPAMGPLFLADDYLIRERISAIRFAGVDSRVTIAEWID